MPARAHMQTLRRPGTAENVPQRRDAGGLLRLAWAARCALYRALFTALILGLLRVHDREHACQ
jgi:hypothetical protein